MKKKNDGIKMLKYFKSAKKPLIFMTLTTISTSAIGIFEPIVNARIIANIMNMTVYKALLSVPAPLLILTVLPVIIAS